MKLQDLQSNTMLVYHITRDENLPAIKTGGLQPRIGANSRDIGETTPAVHVFLSTRSVEEAMMNWDMDWHGDDEPELSMLTLQVPRSMVKPSGKGVTGALGMAEIHEHVPPEMIVDVAEVY